MWEQFLRDVWPRHSGKIIGSIAGFLLGVAIMAFGLFWAILISVLVALGYIVGKKVDEEDEDFRETISRIILRGRR